MDSSNKSAVPEEVLPAPQTLDLARQNIKISLSTDGMGESETAHHLCNDICPGLNANSQSSRYYGFVTGGATPAAVTADNIVTEYDQNVQVHLPNETIATNVEYNALNMLCELFDFRSAEWPHKLFTTGATASNVVGLACGREYIVARAAELQGKQASVAQHGIVKAMRLAGLSELQILTTVPHSSIRKAASILGLGHGLVKDVARRSQKHKFDMVRLEEELSQAETASIIMVSCSEVNTGLFATTGAEMQTIRELADKYGAWVHVDAAFGLLCRVLPENDEFKILKEGVANVELADSIAGDGHKLLNVPYDNGFIFSRHLEIVIQVFQNPGAPYLAGGDVQTPSPLNIGIENSRRFRALPVYANLVAYGRKGYQEMLMRQIRLSRTIAKHLLHAPEYELLPDCEDEDSLDRIFIIVLFRAKDEHVNKELVKRINGTRKIYCSGTKWAGEPAVRFAVSNWQSHVELDWPTIEEVLNNVTKADYGR